MPSIATSRACRWLSRRRAAMVWAAAAAGVLALALFHGKPVAAEGAPQRLAQINIDDFQPARTGGAHSAQQAESSANASFVVISFPAAMPDSVADEVASQYRVEPITRFLSTVLGRRVVLYRVLGERDVEHLLTVLRSDARVADAQLNREYLVLPKGMPPAPVARVPERTPARAAVERRPSARPSYARPDDPRSPRHAARAKPRTAQAERTGAIRSAQGAPHRSASLGGSLRWPTADEPFVGSTAR